MNVGVVTVRMAAPGDWVLWRDLRLAALRESPQAFGSTYARECDRTEADWREWLGREESRCFLGFAATEPVGIAGGYLATPDSVELFSMWVAPSARGNGVAKGLIDGVVQWANDRGAASVHLWVTRGSDVAERVYTRYGFVRTGELQPLPWDPSIDEIGMRLAS